MSFIPPVFFKIEIMEKSRIEQLLDRRALRNEEKEEILKAADAAGLEYRIKKGCSMRCYEGLLLRLYEKATKEERNVSKDGWRLKSATDRFAWQGYIVSNANIKGLKVGAMPSIVVETFFEKAPKGKEAEDGQGSEI